MPAIHLQAFSPLPSPPLPSSVRHLLAGEVLEARTFRIIKWGMGWLGKRMSKGKIFKSMDRLYDSSWRWGGGWMMGDGKEAAKSSWQDSKAFLSRFSSRFKLSSGPTSLTRRHHTN